MGIESSMLCLNVPRDLRVMEPSADSKANARYALGEIDSIRDRRIRGLNFFIFLSFLKIIVKIIVAFPRVYFIVPSRANLSFLRVFRRDAHEKRRLVYSRMFMPQAYGAIPKNGHCTIAANLSSSLLDHPLYRFAAENRGPRLARVENCAAKHVAVDAAARSRLKKRPGGMQVCGVAPLSLSLSRIVPFRLCLAPASLASTCPFRSLFLSLAYLASSRHDAGDDDKVAVYRRYLAETGQRRKNGRFSRMLRGFASATQSSRERAR